MILLKSLLYVFMKCVPNLVTYQRKHIIMILMMIFVKIHLLVCL